MKRARIAAEIEGLPTMAEWRARQRLHAGIALTLGLVGFGLIMMLLTFCAFLVPAEPSAPAIERAPGLSVGLGGAT